MTDSEKLERALDLAEDAVKGVRRLTDDLDRLREEIAAIKRRSEKKGKEEEINHES